VRGRWRPFATLRTDRRGRFRHRHRFLAAGGRHTYRFRLRIRRESGYPFEDGASGGVEVTVAPRRTM
jgi:hypothetical protein